MAVETIVDERGEVRVETGTGTLRDLARLRADLEQGNRNVKVEFDATHTRLNDPVGGWLDTKDGFLRSVLEQALDTGAELEYRIEVHRKRDVPVETPLADLGNRQKVRDLVKITPKGGAQRPSNGSTPPPAQSPRPTPTPQEAPREAPETPRYGEGGVPLNTAAADELERERQAAGGHGSPMPAAEAPEPAPRGRYGPRIEEGRPWNRLNSDGSLNLGSYEAKAALEFSSLAYSLLIEQARLDFQVQRIPIKAPGAPAVKTLARYLLTAADRAQAAVRGDGHVDRMDNSHTRARQAVRAALDVYPVPWGKGEAEKQAWLGTLADHAAMLLEIAVALISDGPEG